MGEARLCHASVKCNYTSSIQIAVKWPSKPEIVRSPLAPERARPPRPRCCWNAPRGRDCLGASHHRGPAPHSFHASAPRAHHQTHARYVDTKVESAAKIRNALYGKAAQCRYFPSCEKSIRLSPDGRNSRVLVQLTSTLATTRNLDATDVDLRSSPTFTA